MARVHGARARAVGAAGAGLAGSSCRCLLPQELSIGLSHAYVPCLCLSSAPLQMEVFQITLARAEHSTQATCGGQELECTAPVGTRTNNRLIQEVNGRTLYISPEGGDKLPTLSS